MLRVLGNDAPVGGNFETRLAFLLWVLSPVKRSVIDVVPPSVNILVPTQARIAVSSPLRGGFGTVPPLPLLRTSVPRANVDVARRRLDAVRHECRDAARLLEPVPARGFKMNKSE